MSGSAKPYEPEDPTELVGVRLPYDQDRSALDEMAVAMAEELALLGFDAPKIERIFTNPFFAGPHRAYLALGQARVREIAARAVPRRVEADGRA